MSKLTITRARRTQARQRKKAAAVAALELSRDLEKARRYLAVNKSRYALRLNQARATLTGLEGTALAGSLRRRA